MYLPSLSLGLKLCTTAAFRPTALPEKAHVCLVFGLRLSPEGPGTLFTLVCISRPATHLC